jgi:hypothetical protein
MAIVMIEISTMIEITFCEMFMRMVLASYEPIAISAADVISMRTFCEVSLTHPAVMRD